MLLTSVYKLLSPFYWNLGTYLICKSIIPHMQITDNVWFSHWHCFSTREHCMTDPWTKAHWCTVWGGCPAGKSNDHQVSVWAWKASQSLPDNSHFTRPWCPSYRQDFHFLQSNKTDQPPCLTTGMVFMTLIDMFFFPTFLSSLTILQQYIEFFFLSCSGQTF